MDTPDFSGSPPPLSRAAYLERTEQLKSRIIDLSRRNMEAAIRILRSWLEDKADGRNGQAP